MKKFINRITNYVKESYYELVNKVSWPTWTEVVNSSVVVLTASVIIAIVIFAMDLVFGASNFSLMHLIYAL